MAGSQQMISVVFVTQKQILHLWKRFWSNRSMPSGIHGLSVVITLNLTSLKLPGGGADFVKKRDFARQKKAALKEKAVAAGRKKGHTNR